jgi:hypothetical protein
MNDTLLIWFNPDRNSYEIGLSFDFRSCSSTSPNADRFEVLYEFNNETKKVAQKVLSRLNLARTNSVPLNY